ncbi:presenilins-associated rhomboid-like protein, mitochondrial isoform X2 [Lingula anatina]|nr:presenilins-associated rhomboid-like protein, mitochondrial isoform X2 [Lingula anatina]XP_013392657.1 presenilins-associated rhomboid-like protein, mitochondrial isoform X2 [Lingula anatina]|eukprot:XP_013392656.1 presenilins-associated rhomboid-like protein, mitochondrial isoform X2 [Lingula anatina]
MKGEKPQNIAEQTSHQAILAGIIGINFAVFLWWRMAKSPKDITIMTKLFTGTLFSKNRCSSMFLSTFSHQEFWHIFLNMYVLWSFRRHITFMEKEEFVAFYLTAGVVASLASYVRLALSPFTAALGASRSLGASGAILAVVAAVISQNPDTRMQIAFIGDIIPHSFEGRHALLFLIALDTIGILRGWKLFDHACHLGGVLFGLWYANYGRKYLWKDPEATVMRFWHKIRHGSRKEK